MGKVFENDDFYLIDGTGNVILSAPHAYDHLRDGNIKELDEGTREMVESIKDKTDCPVITLKRPVNFDPNFDKELLYKDVLNKYIQDSKIKYLFDIHGMKNRLIADIDIGTSYYENVNGDVDLVSSVRGIFQRDIIKTKVDRMFSARGENILSKSTNKKTGVKALQFELAKTFRDRENDNKSFNTMVNSFEKITTFVNNKDSLSEEYISSLKNNITFFHLAFIEFGFEVCIEVTTENSEYVNNMLSKMLNDFIGNKNYSLHKVPIMNDYNYNIDFSDDSTFDDRMKKIKIVLNYFDHLFQNFDRLPYIKSIISSVLKKAPFENSFNQDSTTFYEIKQK